MIEIWVGTVPTTPLSCSELSTAERRHADSLASATRRARFVTTRAWVRERLGSRLRRAPADVPLRVDERGALALADDHLAMSISHDRSLIALALSSSGPVGVDVLSVPSDAGAMHNTTLVLSADEIEFVRSTSPRRQGAAFAHCWTRKEAFAKACLDGIRAPLSHLTLTPSGERVQGTIWSQRVGDAVIAAASRAPAIRVEIVSSGYS